MADKFRVSVKLAEDFCTIEESAHGSGADGHTALVPPVRAERKVNLVKMMKIFGVLLVVGLVSLSVYYFIKLNHKEQELEELRNPNYILTSKYSALSEDQATLQSEYKRSNSGLQKSRDMLKSERKKFRALQSKYVTLNEKHDELTKGFSNLKETLDNVTSECVRNYSDLHDSRDTLQLECNRNNSELQERLFNVSSECVRNYSDLHDSQDTLQSQYTTLNKKHDKLTKQYINLQERFVNASYELISDNTDLQESRDTLQSQFVILNKKHDKLAKQYINLQDRFVNAIYEFLSNNTDLQESRDTLQSQYVTLNEKHGELTKEFSDLKEFYCDATNTSPDKTCSLCKPDWFLFSSKCYFFSTKILNWKESRDWCETKGGRLLNTKSSDVKEFLKGKHKQGYYWIGGYNISKENKSTRMDSGPVKSKRASDDDKEECPATRGDMEKVRTFNCKDTEYWICESATFPLHI